MLISLNWLRKYIDIHVSPEEIAGTLTFLGIEVEEITRIGEEIENVVSALIESCAPHPNADKLSLCRVTDSFNEYDVVCGAPNVKAGQKVLLARIGAVLPGNFKIKPAEIRGFASSGMICAEDELGLGKNHDGILVLSPEIKTGLSMGEIPGLFDAVFELSVTPNRPDALCHLGVARELAAFYKLSLKTPVLKIPSLKISAHGDIKITNTAQSDCPLYTGRILRGVKVGPSPSWLVKVLENVGQKSINNIVDATNYALLEFGQPSHAFDLNKIQSGEIKICRAPIGRTLHTLDGNILKLESDDLVICDGDTPACLAGIIGGMPTMVDNNTTDVFLEVAYFKPSTVRTRAKYHNISTDSSYRFERGVDRLNISWINQYLSELITEIAGGRPDENMLISGSADHPFIPKTVSLRISRVKKILGVEIPRDKIIEMLKSIKIENSEIRGDSLNFKIPGFRPDVEREIDLIEEIARLYNFNNIPAEMPQFVLKSTKLPPLESLAGLIRNNLSQQGLNECISLRFTSIKNSLKLEGSKDDLEQEVVKIMNPLSEEWEILPTSVLINLLKSVTANQNNQEAHCRFFEIGKAFYNHPELLSDKHPGVIEKDKLAIVLSGEWVPCSWQKSGREVDFHILKGIIENLCTSLKIDFRFNYQTQTTFLHPKECATILVGNQVAGYFGTIHPKVKSNFEITGSCAAAEILLNPIIEFSSTLKTFKSFSNVFSVSREMNIVVDENISHEKLMSWMPLDNANYLEEVRLNSIYQGEGLEKGKKAMHYSFIYRHPSKSLTDKDVNAIQEKIAFKLREKPSISFK